MFPFWTRNLVRHRFFTSLHLFLLILLPLSILKTSHLSRNRYLMGPGMQETLFWCLGLSPGSSNFEVYQVLDKKGSFQRIPCLLSWPECPAFRGSTSKTVDPKTPGWGRDALYPSVSRCSRKVQTPGKQTGAHFQFQATSSPSGNSQAGPLRFLLGEHLARR